MANRPPGARARQSSDGAWAVVVALLIALGLASAGTYVNLPQMFRAPDAWTYDWRTAHLAPRVAAPHPDILVVLIDDESLEEYQSRSPVDRRLQAALVSGLSAAGAKAIGLDFIYDRPSEETADRELFSVLRTSRAPVIVGMLDDRSYGTDGRFQKNIDYQSRMQAEVGRDGAHLYFAHERGSLTLGDQVVRYWLGPYGDSPPRKGLAHALAVAGGYQPKHKVEGAQLIDWLRPPATGGYEYPFRTLKVRAHKPGASASELFYAGWEDLVRGRLVLVGGDFPDRDRHLTPFSVKDQARVPGVTVHAQILAQIIDGRKVRTLNLAAETMLLAAITLGAMLIARRYSVGSGDFLVWLGGALGVFLIGVAAYGFLDLIIPSATLFLAWLAGLWAGHPPKGLVRLAGKLFPTSNFIEGGKS